MIYAHDISAATTDPLLQSSDLKYLGAFRLPSGTYGGSSFGYGGWSLAYNAANNSLFIVGHDQQQMVAEITIPQVINSSDINSLKRATVLQVFGDASDGLLGGMKVGGLLVQQGTLYGSGYIYYDSTGSQTHSHFQTGLDLASAAQGLYRVGTLKAGYVSGYMADIPASWQSLFGAPALTGNCCKSIISRTSYGPAVFAFDPKTLGKQDPTPATPLLYYTSTNPLDWGQQSDVMNASTQIFGVVFPAGTRSVLFFGKQGTGPLCYGTGGECGDPAFGAHGFHAYPYRAQVWAYDANDLLRVKNAQIQPWQVKPYGIWPLSFPIPGHEINRLGGVAYDVATGRIYVSKYHGDGTMPLIHVFQAGSVGSTSPTLSNPNAPSNLSLH
jgi:hypothetical protein